MDRWDFENTSLVILGAGFSRAATDGESPLMKGYFDRLDQAKHEVLYDFVLEVGCKRTCPTINDANVEEVLLTLEQARTANQQIVEGWFDRWFDKLDVIRGQLGEYTLDRLSDLYIDSENWAANALASTGFSTTYISMNYDNVAERILSHRRGTRHHGASNCPNCRMVRLLNHACSCAYRSNEVGDRWQGAIVKPHGSIAWRRCVDSACCSAECIIPDRNCRPFRKAVCKHCGEACAPVMVFPTMSKNLNETPQINSMWQAAKVAIEQAKSILLFGFSLTTSDQLFSQLMRVACNKNKCLRRVGVIDINPATVLDRFRSSVDPSGDVEFVALPVHPNEIPNWYEIPREAVLQA